MQAKREWMVRAMAESVLITFSILLALAVDSWAEQRNNEELAVQSLQIFEREIAQNLARVEDLAPYHRGLGSVVAEIAAQPSRAGEMRSVLEGLEPPVLLDTAWQTAVAVGALTHMDFDVVQALSLTYSIQDEFRARSAPTARPRVEGPVTAATADGVLAYVTELYRSEDELRGVYAQALAIVRERLPPGFALTGQGDAEGLEARARSHP